MPNRNVLFAPGPTEVPKMMRDEFFKDSWHHRQGPYFPEREKVARDLMKKLFGAEHAEIIFWCANGTRMMNEVGTHFIGPRDNIMVIKNGYFGDRWEEIARTFGKNIYVVEAPWGHTYTPETVIQLLKKKKIKLILVQATDTATGIRNDLGLLGTIVAHHSPNTLIAVDAVLEALVSKINMRDEGINILIGSGQKELLLPPGMGFVIIDPAAERALEKRSWPTYLEFKKELDAARKGYILSTPPVNHIAALSRLLEKIAEDERGWYKKIEMRAEDFRKKMYSLDFSLYTKDKASHGLSVLIPPPPIKVQPLVAALQKKGLTISPGIGKNRDEVIRIAHFRGISKKKIETLIEAIAHYITTEKFILGL